MLRKLHRLIRRMRLALALCLVFVVVDQTLGQSSSKEIRPKDRFVGWGIDSLYHVDQGVRGAASCATSSCHGGPKAGVASDIAPRGSEYPLWFEADPHAQSWKTISSDTSYKILTKLGILKDGKVADLAGYRNCLACHNTEKNLGSDQLTPLVAEGVGCESCHGPSEKWFDRHYQGIESTELARRKLGLTNSRPLLQRAKICATCHVGGKDRDMNHDIIAAGHPALYFDMAVYHEAYPKHWRDPEQKSSDFRAKLWLAGQIAAGDSELELIEARVCRSLPVSTWPELAVYQCNSCHKLLNGIPKANQSVARELQVRGRAAVREWNWAGLSQVIDSAGSADGNNNDVVKNLRTLLSAADPIAAMVTDETQKLRLRLYETLWENDSLSLPGWSRQKQIEVSIMKLEQIERNNSWEFAAGAYASAWATSPKIANSKLQKPMTTLRAGLFFPKDRITARFPISKAEQTPPTSKDWNESLLLVINALKSEVR